MTEPTEQHREEARKLVGNVSNYADEHTGELSISAFGPLSNRIAELLASRDTEALEALDFINSGVEFDDPRLGYVVMQVDRQVLEAGKRLWDKLQPVKEGKDAN